MNIRQILKNRNLLAAILLFELLIIWDAVTVIYVIVSNPYVHFTNAFSIVEGAISLTVATVGTLILILIVTLIAFTKLRTTTILTPVIAFVIAFLIFMFSGGGAILFPFIDALGPIMFGLFMLIYQVLLFYGPAAWFYFRFRMPYLAVGWLSSWYLISIAVNAFYEIEAGGFEQITALLRPDVLAICGVFYFLTMLLLILDNSQSLARWKRIPQKFIKIPLRTVISVLIVLIITTIGTNLLSPMIWKVLWREAHTNPEKLEKEDVPDPCDDGRGGNMCKDDDMNQVNPEPGLESEVSKGDGSILFTVQVSETEDEYDPYGYGDNYYYKQNEPELPHDFKHYWKMENLDQFSDEKGFHKDWTYEEYKYNTLDDRDSWAWFYFLNDYTYPTQSMTQITTFYNLKTNWVIGMELQEEIRLLNGNSREIYQFESGAAATEQEKPFTKGDSYELVSLVSTMDFKNPNNYTFQNYKLCTKSDSSDSYEYPDYESYYLCIESEDIEPYTEGFDTEVKLFTDEILSDAQVQDKSQYYKAKAIHDYLLTNYEYSLSPGTPEDLNQASESLDRLKHFLFESKKGHCLYFASAMTLMLRSQDIPARVVTGFAEGTYSDELDSYIVTTGEAHAWVEVYFGEYGWITVDPTPPSPEEESENKENLEQRLTEEGKAELEDMQEEANKKKDEFDEKETYDYDYDPYEPPKWLEDLAATFQQLLELLKCAIPACCILLILLVLSLPPAVRVGLDEYLKGTFASRPDREQIISYFKFVRSMLKRFGFAKLNSESALEYAHRIIAKGALSRIQDKTIRQETETALKSLCTIYNRAAFRHKLKPNDRAGMERSTRLFARNFIEGQSVVKIVLSYYGLGRV